MREDVLRVQRELNIESAAMWEEYAPHRQKVTGHVLRVHNRADSGRLVVLGAGNCNDLDLGLLSGAFSQIDLVDLDGDALDAGVKRQEPHTTARTTLHGGVDATALPAPLTDRLGGADVVLSACLLTQLIDAAEQDGLDGAGMLAVRNAHLRLIARLTRAGGVGLVVTDVVSADTLPGLETTEPDRLPALLVESLDAGNFFTGANPFAIERALATDAEVAARRAGVTAPWLWRLGRRTYLVCAVAFQKAALQK